MYNNEDTKVVKSFVCRGEESWCRRNSRLTLGALIIYPDTMEISVSIFKGVQPYFSDIIKFMLQDKDVRLLIHQYQQKGRKKLFSMRCSKGLSGREDYYINFPDEETRLVIDGKHLLHISCFGKISGIQKMYIGDFVELVSCICKNTDFMLLTRKQKNVCKYVKPYFAYDASTEVSKII